MLDNPQSDAQNSLLPLPSTAEQRPSSHRLQRKSICIVTQSSVSQNPRVVKEADALAAAGHDVVVLFPQQFEWARAMDRRILERAKWRADIVEVLPTIGGTMRRLMAALQIRLCRLLSSGTMGFPIAELAASRYFPMLLARAVRHRSDLYIGHYTASLPVVAWATRLTHSKFAFDFEDFHRGEFKPEEMASLSARLIAALEGRYLPAASFLTAASWGIAEEVGTATGLAAPTTILNVFPWSDRGGLPVPNPRPPRAALSLYWFSQIVSLDRGLQDVIGAMALMQHHAELHIRGDDASGSIESLRRLVRELRISDRVHFHPVDRPENLLVRAAEHDVGLCLEVPATRNRDVCITNKMFLYMLAGLAIVASRTRGQTDVLNAAPEIGCLYDCGDVHALAAILDRYATNPASLARAKAASLAASRERWNWERESRLIVGAIDRFSFEAPGNGG